MEELKLQHVGLGEFSRADWFGKDMVDYVSKMVTSVLKKSGYNVIVPDDKIVHVMTEVYKNQVPETGDIHSRFIIGDIVDRRDYAMEIINKTIEIITSQIRDEFDTVKQNKSFSKWNSEVLGEQNVLGIRRHAPIKLNRKGYNKNLTFWNY